MAKKEKEFLRANKETHRVILMGNVAHDYHRGLLRGIANYCNKNRKWDIHIEQPLPVSKLFELAKYWEPDGVIMCFYGMIDNIKADPSYIHDIGELSSSLDLPILATVPPTKKYKQLGFISPNHIYVGTIAAEYFMEKGLKSYAFCGYKDVEWSRKRFEGYLETLQTKGHTASIYEQNYAGVLKKRREEILFIADWLKQLIFPVAIFVCHDMLAIYVAEACKLIDLKVPQDIAILGVDNDEVKCGLFNPSLSSIAMNTERAGYEAAELLEKSMARQKVESNLILVQPKYVVERQSTDVLAVDHPDVAEALRFIRSNKTKALTVTEIAEHVFLHRRVLYDLFQKHLGCSIYDEVKRVRIDEIARLLLETNWTVSKISRHMGFGEVRNFARYFAHAKGMSPTEYREHSHS